MIVLSENCKHEMCRTCLQKTLEMELERNGYASYKIECLWCPNLLSMSLIQEIMGDDAERKKKLNNIYWVCPQCDNLIYIDTTTNYSLTSLATLHHPIPKGSFQVRCTSCPYVLCTSCNGTHPWTTPCKDYLANNEDALKSYLWKIQNTKRCPKCFVFIEKRGGCSYMVCFRCGFEFCFDCLRQYKNFHHCDNEMVFFKLLFMLLSIIGSFYIVYTLKQLSRTFKD
ncbi:hypothetical protein PPL_09173 [Heterostelium album PN500]|uniref:RING-type domain-containing protein n=1 Tax=Heterostelium pallidum (strain ATCC 26659 / Pp 5 / PN500) TaxID=670386 RepID=D3BKU1_HETP5|nr:hypothetical protein PPL_09173 [Heterostelium album PN500]EFA78521.1 hypothetical protein PPL_09173 [Heterostelium album PN500]|eukprot:XP_020430645.1 hypothetical protein PPL_09173 [Heterostelium album PN500]